MQPGAVRLKAGLYLLFQKVRVSIEMAQWVNVCSPGDIEQEGAVRFKHDGKLYAVYRSPDDEYFCTDGICSHEHVDLTDGLVMDDTIECPKHGGVFNYKTGEAMRAPVCVNLKTYKARLVDCRIMIEV